MRQTSRKYLDNLRQNKRILPLAAVTFSRSGTPAQLFSSENISERIFDLARWETWADFEAGAHDGTVTRVDPDGRAYLTLPGDAYTALSQIDDETQYIYSLTTPWLGRYSDGKIFIMYIEAGGAAGRDLILKESTDEGITWSAARYLRDEIAGLPPYVIGGFKPVTIGGRTIVDRLLYTDDNGATWVYDSDGVLPLGEGASSFVFWGNQDNSRAWLIEYDEFGDMSGMAWTEDGAAWTAPQACNFMNPGPLSGYTHAMEYNGRHYLVSVRYSPQQLRYLVYVHNSGNAHEWTLWQTIIPPVNLDLSTNSAIIRCHACASGQMIVSLTEIDSDHDYWPTGWTMQAPMEGQRFSDFSSMYEWPEFAWNATFLDATDGRLIGAVLYGDAADPGSYPWLPTPYISASAPANGTWTSAVKDTEQPAPRYHRVILDLARDVGITDAVARFRANATADTSAVGWTPTAPDGWHQGAYPAGVDRERYAQAQVYLSTLGFGYAPRVYAVGLSAQPALRNSTVRDWGEFSVSMGEFHAQMQFGTIALEYGAAQAALWPWHTATVYVGLYPQGGRYTDILWLYSARCDRASCEGDTLTLWLGEASDGPAALNARLDLPVTDQLGWPTGQTVPYVLGDWTGSTWADPPQYFGSGGPRLIGLTALDAAGALWEVEYARSTDDWTVLKEAVQQTARAGWGVPYESDGAEVRFTVAMGSERPKNGDRFSFQTHQGGRLTAVQIARRTRYALTVGDCEVESVWDGSSKVSDGDYDVRTAVINGYRITYLELSSAPSSTVTWTGRGAKLDGADAEFAHEHARQIVWQFCRGDAADWDDIIHRRAWLDLGNTCRASGYRTRMALTSRCTVREALERLLLGVATWTIDGTGRIRFAALEYAPDSAAATQDIPSRHVEGWAQWEMGGYDAARNVVDIRYDGSASNPPMVTEVDDRALRELRISSRGALDGMNQHAAEAIYSESAAREIGRQYLRRNARPGEPVAVEVPLDLYAHLDIRDLITASGRFPDRNERTETTDGRKFRIEGITCKINSFGLNLQLSPVPIEPIELGET